MLRRRPVFTPLSFAAHLGAHHPMIHQSAGLRLACIRGDATVFIMVELQDAETQFRRRRLCQYIRQNFLIAFRPGDGWRGEVFDLLQTSLAPELQDSCHRSLPGPLEQDQSAGDGIVSAIVRVMPPRPGNDFSFGVESEIQRRVQSGVGIQPDDSITRRTG